MALSRDIYPETMAALQETIPVEEGLEGSFSLWYPYMYEETSIQVLEPTSGCFLGIARP